VTLETITSLVIFIAAGFLGLCGMLMLRQGEQALATLAHTKASLVQTFAARYLAMAFIMLGLVSFREWRALSIVLVVGAVMAALDYHFVGKAGGKTLPHAAAGVACFVLAACAFTLSRA
jgi:hypothetical protein